MIRIDLDRSGPQFWVLFSQRISILLQYGVVPQPDILDIFEGYKPIIFKISLGLGMRDPPDQIQFVQLGQKHHIAVLLLHCIGCHGLCVFLILDDAYLCHLYSPL